MTDAKGTPNVNARAGNDFQPTPQYNANNQRQAPQYNNGYAGPPMAQGYNANPYNNQVPYGAPPANYAMAANPGNMAWKNRYTHNFYFCCSCVTSGIAPRVLRSFLCSQITLNMIFLILSIRAVASITEAYYKHWWGYTFLIMGILTILGHLFSIIMGVIAKSKCEKYMYQRNAGEMDKQSDSSKIQNALKVMLFANILEIISYAITISIYIYISLVLDSIDDDVAQAFSGFFLMLALALVPIMLFFVGQVVEHKKMMQAAKDIAEFPGYNTALGNRGNNTYHGGVQMNQINL